MFFNKVLDDLRGKTASRRRMRVGLVVVALGLVLLSAAGALHIVGAAHADGPTVNINKNIVYQQIDGFGTFGNKLPDYFGQGEDGRWDDTFLNTLVGNLGASINRESIKDTFEPSRGTYQSSVMQIDVDYVKALEAKASQLGLPPVKIILSLWSPPAWMKQNGSTSGTDSSTNRLKDDDQTRQDFADFMVRYIQAFKDGSGVYPYAVSLQNEPQLALSYASCYYTPEDMAKVLAVLGPALQQANIPSKIFYPENVSDSGRLAAYLSSAEQNATAHQYLNIFAVHGYSGSGTNPLDDNTSFWKGIYNMAAPYNLPVWMTETSGYDTSTWSAAQKLGVDMYSALKFGHLSAWVWWLNTDWDSPGEALLDNSGNPTMRSEVSQQFYHYIRPGAVMIDAASNDPDVLSLAFNDSANHKLTVVLINNGGSSKSVALNFQGSNLPSQYTAYRTSASEAVANVGTVTNSVTLPANSITTLDGSFSGNDGNQAPTIQQSPQSQTVSPGQQVTLNVLHSGTPPFTYQWQRNGSDIAGAVGPQYSFTATNDDNGAQYRVTVSNAYGQVTSSTATITLGSFSGALAAHSTGSITVDGSGSDAVWSTANSYTVGNQQNGTPKDNFGGSFQLAWDNTNLYALVKVRDDNYTSNSDAIEIYVDGANNKSTGYDSNDWQIALNQSDYSMAIYQNGQRVNPPTFPGYGQAGGSGGYSQEIAIPWADLGQTPAAGHFVGIDIALIQGSTSAKMFWHATTNDDWHDPSQFGVAQLSGDGGTGSTPTPAPTPTPGTTPTPTPTPGTTPTPTPTAPPSGTWQHQDIGSVNVAGSISVNGSTIQVNGSGSDIGSSPDSFQFAYQSLNGNGTIVARVASMDYPNGYARAGVMIRESLNNNAAFDFVGLNVCCGTVTQARTTTGGGSSWNPVGSGSVPYWVKLTRSGNTFTTYVSSDGSNWTQLDSQSITMASSVYIGLAVTSHNNDVVEHATFDHVSVTAG